MTNQTFSDIPQKGSLERVNRLASPPRKVPLPTACAILSGPFSLFWAFFFFFTMYFFWKSGDGMVLIVAPLFLCYLIYLLVSGTKKIKLLRSGEITGSTKMRSTHAIFSVSFDDVPVMIYSYEFRDRQGRFYKGATRTLRTKNIYYESSAPVLYLPSNPRQSMLLDTLPLKYPLEADKDGQWYHRGAVKPVLLFLLTWFLVLIPVVSVFFIISGR